MDILSFILGISVVVVTAVAVVAVIAFVKVSNINKEINSIHQTIGNEIENQNKLHDNVRRDFDTITNEIYRTIDSRLDKLESKLINKK